MGKSPIIRQRLADPAVVKCLQGLGLPPILARLYAARGVSGPEDIGQGLGDLLPLESMKGLSDMACFLADAIEAGKRILVIGDFDGDGCGGTVVAVRGLRSMGAVVDYLVPSRFSFGYGLTPGIVGVAAESNPDIILTIDNGIASLDGVEEAKSRGITVCITDHHLPGDTLPDARIINPNQPGCQFASKNLAGAGVAFYLVMAIRSEMRKRGVFIGRQEPKLASLLDVVAMSTVADMVKLDKNNRIIVDAGLQRMRAGQACPGMRALFQVSGRQIERASVMDLGFFVGPRINAAGRIDSMHLGIECLLSDNYDEALGMAMALDRLNRERREIEAEMRVQADTLLDGMSATDSFSFSLHDPTWHQGVIGLLASRIKDRFFRPTMIFSDDGNGDLKGSGRSIPGLHLRDALDLVDKRNPGLIIKFGGHSGACGMTLRGDGLSRFRDAFEQVCRESMSREQLDRSIETDGNLDPGEINLECAEMLTNAVWGQGFPQPLFEGEFDIRSQKILSGKHLKLTLETRGIEIDGIFFGQGEFLSEKIHAVFRMDVNDWRGNRTVQLMVEHATSCPDH